jgi:hypothetical protein
MRGNTFRNLALQVGGSSKACQQIMVMSPAVLGPEKTSMSRPIATLNYRPTLSSERAAHIIKYSSVYRSIISEEEK